MPRFVRLSTFFAWCFAAMICGAGLVLASFYLYLAPNLPDAEQLKTTQLQTPLRIYSADNKKIAEFGEKRRTPVSYLEIPSDLINAFVAAEDNRFFEHGGIDLKGLARATTQLLTTGRIVSGGSTITMQVAKNFFLSRERTFIRKFNEIFLALQIEQSLKKEEILELYLNKIYLGNRAYGIHAAAEVYYGKSISDLTIAEMAMIAGLPKAPSRYNPLSNAKRAKIRRNWILDRMLELEMIDSAQHSKASLTPVTARFHGGSNDLDAPYLAEMARLEVVERFGADAYTEGYQVFLTINSEHQIAANKAVKAGLEAYDQRHGYRGPTNQLTKEQIGDPDFVSEILRNTKTASNSSPALVLAINKDKLAATLANGESITLDLADHAWLRPFININRVGEAPSSWNEVLAVGDIIELKQATPIPVNGTDDEETQPLARWQLHQTPEAQGALVSIAPQDGAIMALVGGYDFELSHYNRATQAKRQPGSNFKPFVYLAGLEQGNTAATLINDAPIVFDDKNLEEMWRPENSSGRFYGPTRLRKALYNSRNLVSIRLLKNIGIRSAINTIEKFGFERDSLPRDLSLALGSAGMTPLSIATAYAMIANGGHFIEPYLIQRIENAAGDTIYEADPYIVCTDTECANDTIEMGDPENEDHAARKIAPRIAEERALYILHSMLKDVITKGTGRRALPMKRTDLAGKTGTTNDQKDAWFSGYNTKVQASVWVGFDNPSSLGKREYGAKAALPIWMDYMQVALKDVPHSDLARPAGIVTARIDASTGELAPPGSENGMFEIFREEFAPKQTFQPTPLKNQTEASETTISPEDIF